MECITLLADDHTSLITLVDRDSTTRRAGCLGVESDAGELCAVSRSVRSRDHNSRSEQHHLGEASCGGLGKPHRTRRSLLPALPVVQLSILLLNLPLFLRLKRLRFTEQPLSMPNASFQPSHKATEYSDSTRN